MRRHQSRWWLAAHSGLSGSALLQLGMASACFTRVGGRAGCPKCSNVLKVTQPQPTFAEAQPACLAEWDYEHNDAEDMHPDNITLGSGKMVHLICSCCPRGQPHRWTARPCDRVVPGDGCAVYAGKYACICNSLATSFPHLAAEFDVDKNGFAPSEIPARSNKKVWWRNARRGSWRQALDIRTDKRSSCYTQQVWLLCVSRALTRSSSTVDILCITAWCNCISVL